MLRDPMHARAGNPPPWEDTTAPEYRGRLPQSYLSGAERGNPVGVCSGRQGVRLVGQWANRKDGLTPQEDKMSQEAKGADRKVTGIHNRAHRAAMSGETRPARVLTWGRGSGDETAEHRNTVAKVRYGPCGCKQTHRGATLSCQ